MGCDIHLYKEKQINGEWVTADNWRESKYEGGGMEVPWSERFTRRNYQLFGLLVSGVRSEHKFSFKDRGFPFNPCKEVAGEAADWGIDGHSHSYLYLHELKDMAAFLKSQTMTITGMKDRDELAALNASIASGTPNWDLLFPYCQFTNDPKQAHFEVDVPADFYVGDHLREIIDSFNGIDGDNHRIVFFFDN